MQGVQHSLGPVVVLWGALATVRVVCGVFGGGGWRCLPGETAVCGIRRALFEDGVGVGDREADGVGFGGDAEVRGAEGGEVEVEGVGCCGEGGEEREEDFGGGEHFVGLVGG